MNQSNTSFKISIYSYCWNVIKYNFDFKDAIKNWALYSDEIVIAVNTSEDNSFEAIQSFVNENNFNVKLIKTEFDSKNDPFYYGKVVNAALQACSGDLLIQQDMDERLYFNKKLAPLIYNTLVQNNAKAFFVPTIDLYGNVNNYISINRKWYVHLRGIYRGAVNFGIKNDGRPDYNKTSTDEAIDENGNLVPTIPMIEDLSIESLRRHVSFGLPVVYHLGYVNLTDRVERAKWWKDYWEKATNGDKNGHITDINVLLEKNTKPHGLPLWKTI